MRIEEGEVYTFELRISKKKLFGKSVDSVEKYFVTPVVHFESGSMFTSFFICNDEGNVAAEDSNDPFRTYLSKEQLGRVSEGKWFDDGGYGPEIMEARISKI